EEYAPEGRMNAAYIQLLAEELVPFIEQRYAVRTQKDSRIAAGDSLGAAASLHLALQYPDLFAQVLSLSGAFLDRTQAALAAQEDLSWLNMYMLIGLDETAVQT